jgi:ssDNA-binding Zn-finger/Zn-ribbon topoisomerase 1
VDRHETLDQTTEWVSAVCEEIADNEYEIGRSIRHEEDACPECGADMWLNKSEHGLYWSCETSWDECDYTEGA